MKRCIRNICNIISTVLVIAFFVKTIIDYIQYDALVTSAPFSVNILVNVLFLIIPALIIYIIGFLINRLK